MTTTFPKPTIPSTVIRFVGQSIPRILPSFADVVAVPIVHDWGPLGSDSQGTSGLAGGAQEVLNFAEFTALYGDSDTAGRTAVAGAFAGQGLQDTVGAGGVIVYRLGTGAAAAQIVVNNTGAAPALTLAAKYKGTRGNRISYVLAADPNVAANDRLQIRLDGNVVESFSYARTDIVAAAAAINLTSNFVVATETATGTALTTTAGTSLVGGSDGSAPVVGDHSAALTALQYQPFSILSPYDVTDSPTQAAYLAFAQGQAAASRPVMTVLGGAAAETMTAAITGAASLADPHVIRLGAGTWHDDLLGKDLSTSQLAPRIAGILAARGQSKSLTGSKIGGLHPVGTTAPSESDIGTGLQNGVTTFMRVSSADADLRIAKGVTTWARDTTSDQSLPVDVFGDPRKVRILDIYIRTMREWGDDNIVGNTTVTDATRAMVRGQARMLQDNLLEQGLILPGNAKANPPIPAPFANADPPTDPSLSDAIPYSFGWAFSDTANFVLGQGVVR